MIKFHYYATPNGERSSYKGVPIQLLSEFRRQFGSAFRIRYRGNRIKFKGLDGRTSTQCYQDCIKKRADFFSAYAIDYKRKNMDNLTVIVGGVEYVRKDNEIKELERDLSLASHEDERKQLIINDLERKLDNVHELACEFNNEKADLEQELAEANERIEELEDVIQSIRYECDRV
jgi:predicted RNase H-like nuclease (RuvC/YqgF family)